MYYMTYLHTIKQQTMLYWKERVSYNILYNSANRMFSSEFLKQETIQTQDNMLPFCSPYPFIIQNLWPSHRLLREDWTVGNICPHNGLVPGSKAGKGLYLPPISLSLIDKDNQGRTQWECHKCQTVHTEDLRSTRTQWCIVPNWLSVIGAKSTLERNIFPVRRTDIHSRDSK